MLERQLSSSAIEMGLRTSHVLKPITRQFAIRRSATSDFCNTIRAERPRRPPGFVFVMEVISAEPAAERGGSL